MSKKDNENLHLEHRKRVRNRFLNHGFETFDDHVILESVLFYSLKRGDTNPVAHRLMNRFGSLVAVLEAPYEELISVKGVGKITATYIMMLRSLIEIFNLKSINYDDVVLSVESLGDLASEMLISQTNETVLLMFIKKKKIVETKIVSKGGKRNVLFDVTDMIRKALEASCDMIAIAHNHLDGSLSPSVDDYRTFYILNNIVENMKMRMFEYYIVSGDKYYPLIANGDMKEQENLKEY